MLSTGFDDSVVGRKIALAANEVCSGEIIQTQRRFDMQLGREDYFDIIRKKTAALFAAAMELGARLNGQEPSVCEALRQFGLNVGTAYQIYDDCIDLIGDEKDYGKTLRTDLNKGKLTLPILNLLGSATERQREKLNRLLLQREPIDISALANIADYVGAIEASVDTGQELVSEARGLLEVLPESEHKAALAGITTFLSALLEAAASDGSAALPAWAVRQVPQYKFAAAFVDIWHGTCFPTPRLFNPKLVLWAQDALAVSGFESQKTKTTRKWQESNSNTSGWTDTSPLRTFVARRKWWTAIPPLSLSRIARCGDLTAARPARPRAAVPTAC